MRASMRSRRPRCAAIPRRARNGPCNQMLLGAKASKRLGLSSHVSFPGALAWPYLYPWPPRPAGLIETAFDELARRWRPILDAYDEAGVDIGFELHPGEDLFDGATFEMFLERVGNHPRCGINYDPSHFLLQQLDYLRLHRRLPRADQGVPRQGRRVQPDPRSRASTRGFQPWLEPGRPVPLARRRPGRLRRHLLEARRLRLRELGGAGVGMLPEASRGWCPRGGGVHRRSTSSG